MILKRRFEKHCPSIGLQQTRLPAIFCAALAALVWIGSSDVCCQDPIVLRDLTIIRGKTITGFDDAAVKLSDGSALEWDQILSAQVDPNRQADFDDNIANIGLPLFRIKTRVANRDWSAIGELVEPLYAGLKLEGLRSPIDSESAYLICYATMKGRLDRGDRPGAVLPFLQAARIQQLNRKSGATSKHFLPDIDASTMLSSEILPIWFDRARVEPAFNALANSIVPTATTTEFGAIVYLVSMAVEMDRFELARDLLKLIENRDGVEAWRLVLLAQIKIAENELEQAARLLDDNQSKLLGAAVPLGLYLKSEKYFQTGEALRSSGAAAPATKLPKNWQSQIDQYSRVMLELLEIPASYGEMYPALAAAALYQTAQIAKSLEWSQEGQVLEQELLLRFPSTYHARVVKNRLLEQEN
jgi:hypothetical protein